jgi:hypothetical protein
MSAARLKQLKAYLAEAKLDPENNKLYIQDLEESIENFKYLNKRYEAMEGFDGPDAA